MLNNTILSGEGFELKSKGADYSELNSEIVLNLNFEYTNTSDVQADAFTEFTEKYIVSSEAKLHSDGELKVIEPNDSSTDDIKMATTMVEPGETINVTISFAVKDPSTEILVFEIPKNEKEAILSIPILSYDEWIKLDEK